MSVIIHSNNICQETHYEIIGVKEDADHEDIRKTYRSTILNYHPDKFQKKTATSNGDHEAVNRFLQVQNAWKVLGDPKSRSLYDNELRALRQDNVTAEDVSLEDMTMEVDSDGGSFELSYCCRCGDYFSVDSAELAEIGYQFSRKGSEISLQTVGSLPASVVLPCGSCSLKVRLVINANTTLLSDLNT